NRYNNISYEEKNLPVGPLGEELAEMGLEDVQDIWKIFNAAIIQLLQVSEEEYNAIYESAIQYLKTVGAKM
ncbi:10921_t:CDS:2, partial [Paraglomus occultum]